MSAGTSVEIEIRERAQQIWEERQATGRKGDAASDWAEAEAQVRERMATTDQPPV